MFIEHEVNGLGVKVFTFFVAMTTSTSYFLWMAQEQHVHAISKCE